MSIKDFRKLKQIIDQAISGIEDQDKQKEIIKSILSEAGVFYSEWIEFNNMVAEGIEVKSSTIKEELTNQFENRLSETDVKISNIKPSIVNKIVKQITREKPIIVNKSEIIEKTIREVDPTSLEEVINRIRDLEERFKGIKIPQVPNYEKLKTDLEGYSADYISGKWGEMPSFRLLGMGLRGDIDSAITRITSLEGSAGHDALTLDANAGAFLSLSTQELGLDTQTANKVFASPVSGAAAVPTFRALVALDIPDLSATYLAVGGKAADSDLLDNHDTSYFATAGQQFYIGTTQVAINRASAALTLAGITLTTPEIGEATGTSLHLTTLLTDHIGEHTGAHTIVADNTITAQDIIISDAKQIKLTVPTADVTCTGFSTSAFVSGYTSSAVGDLVYLDSSAKWQKVDVDSSTTSYGLIAIALAVAATDAALLVALPGSFVRVNAWNWTPGATLYASETAGGIATAIPTGADNVVRVIGFACNADYIYFMPSSDVSTTVA